MRLCESFKEVSEGKEGVRGVSFKVLRFVGVRTKRSK